jgi:hypothetical protein
MRYFLTGRIPDVKGILLVESGARGLVEKLIPILRSTWGADIPIDLVSCFATLPAGFTSETTRIYRVSDFRGRTGRGRLYAILKANGYTHVGVICSGEPLMTKWKWSLVLRIPAKVFIINENGDFFWLARTHSKIIRRFVLQRTGLAGAGAVRTLSGLIALPFTLLYLLLYAAVEHTRRALR